jgi:putative serine protease PepD
MNAQDEPTTTDQKPRGHRRAARVGATLAAGAALGAAAFAGVHGLDSSGAADDVLSAAAQVTTVAQSGTTYDAEALYKKAAPGVVGITVTTGSSASSDGTIPPYGPGGGSGSAQGTGFVYDKSGHIVTAAHVVDDATAISVRFADGTRAKATLVGTDPSSDTAVIKVNVASSKLTPIALADSSAVNPGEGVVAIGSPFGLEGSITAGIVSAVGRSIEAPNGFTIPNAIQTDAPINHGNSGGPLIDATGKVIGVNVQISTGDSSASINAGVGFAVPSNTVKAVVTDLIAGKTVSHPYLGVSVADNASGTGAVISTVKDGSPADQAGLRSDDVVTAIDGKPITGSSDLTSAIATYEPGDKIALTVKRNGSTTKITVTLGTRPATTA